MRKLFEGNITVMFANSCGLNNGRPINLSFHAYATNVTTNYSGGNTVDVCIKSGNGKTITLYTVDAYAVERKLNSIVGNYSDYNGHFGINN
jgi:phosphoribosylformylglycinamidine (FGAM) synthase-like amidotransferase family enzyme